MLKIELPLAVYVSKKKKFILNLNNYRNAHWLVLNRAKAVFTQEVTQRLNAQGLARNKPISGSVRLTYQYYHPSKRKVDVANPCSVIDKFACDTLTAYGYWPDDDNSVVKMVSYLYAGVDKDNPRCELVILPFVV